MMLLFHANSKLFSCQQQVIAVPGTNTVLLELALRELALRELRWHLESWHLES